MSENGEQSGCVSRSLYPAALVQLNRRAIPVRERAREKQVSGAVNRVPVRSTPLTASPYPETMNISLSVSQVALLQIILIPS